MYHFTRETTGGVIQASHINDLQMATEALSAGALIVRSSGTDDTTAIQDAINAAAALSTGAVVLLPDAAYTVSAPLTLARGVTLRGAGLSTVLLYRGTGTVAISYPGQSVTSAPDRLGLSDLTIRGGGVWLGNSMGAALSRLWIDQAPGDGVTLSLCLTARLESVRVTSAVGNGIVLTGTGTGAHTTSTVLAGCQAVSCGGAGLALSFCETITVEGFVGEACQRGILIGEQASIVTIIGCHLEANTVEQITVAPPAQAANHITIVGGSLFVYDSAAGMSIANSLHAVLVGFRAEGCGLTIAATSGNVIVIGTQAISGGISDQGVGTVLLG